MAVGSEPAVRSRKRCRCSRTPSAAPGPARTAASRARRRRCRAPGGRSPAGAGRWRPGPGRAPARCRSGTRRSRARSWPEAVPITSRTGRAGAVGEAPVAGHEALHVAPVLGRERLVEAHVVGELVDEASARAVRGSAAPGCRQHAHEHEGQDEAPRIATSMPSRRCSTSRVTAAGLRPGASGRAGRARGRPARWPPSRPPAGPCQGRT